MTYNDTAWIPITHHILPWYTMIYYDIQDIIVKSPLDNITPYWLYIHSFHVLRLLSHGLKAWYFSWWKERPMAWKTHGYQVDDISFGINSKLESGWLYTLQVYINPNSADQSVHWWVWFRSCHLWTLILEVSQISDSFKPNENMMILFQCQFFCLTLSVPPLGASPVPRHRGLILADLENLEAAATAMVLQGAVVASRRVASRAGPSDGSKNGPNCWRIKELMGLEQFKPQDIWIHLVDLNGLRTFLSWIKWDFRRWRIQNVGQPGPMSGVSIRNTKVGMLFCILQEEGSQETYIQKNGHKNIQKLCFFCFVRGATSPSMPWWDFSSQTWPSNKKKIWSNLVPESFRFLKFSGAAQGQKAVDMV